MALTKAAGLMTAAEWTALASGTVVVAGQLDVSDAYETTLVIQAMLDTDATAHVGTEFIIQGRAATTDTNRDWYDICRFVDLVNAAPQLIGIAETVDTNEERVTVDENPTTLITIGTTDSPLPWVGVENTGDVLLSEMVMATDGDADEIWLLTSNEAGTEYLETAQADDDSLCNVAISRGITIGIGHYRLRVVINNNYDVNGNTLNYRIKYIKVTAL
jgi:hypothetical protein